VLTTTEQTRPRRGADSFVILLDACQDFSYTEAIPSAAASFAADRPALLLPLTPCEVRFRRGLAFPTNQHPLSEDIRLVWLQFRTIPLLPIYIKRAILLASYRHNHNLRRKAVHLPVSDDQFKHILSDHTG
jgi:hypothetical protein